MLLVVGAVAVIAVGWGTWSWFSAQSQPQQYTVPEGKELIKPDKTYLSSEDAKADRQISLTLLAPKEWRSTRLKAASSELIIPKDYSIGRFSFTAGGDNLEPTAQLAVENVSNWLISSDASKLPGYDKLTTKQAKQNAVDNLRQLRRTREVTADNLEKLVPLQGEVGSKEYAQYVNSADSKLSGVLYAVEVQDGDTKTVHIIADMAGVIDGQTILMRFDMTVPDATSVKDESVKKAVEEVVELVKSLTLDTSIRNPQAPAVSR